MRSMVIVLGMMLLSACTMGPDYVRPHLDIPETWRVELQEGERLVDSAWWETFNDPVLSGLIRSALEANLDLQIAAARVDQYLGILDVTRSQFFPQTGYGFGAGRLDNAPAPISPVDPPPFTTYQATVNTGWELDLWGRIRRADEAARAQVLATEEGRRAMLLSLVANVAASYITLRGIDRQSEIAEATEQSYGETLRIFRLRHRHGTISRVELSQVESQYEVAAQAIPRLQAQSAQQENLLSILLGGNPGTVPRGKSIEEMAVPPLPGELPLTLLERRPDIRQAEYDLIASNARIGEAKALYFPTVSLTGLLGRQSSELSELFSADSGTWSLNGSLTGPLFTFGAISGQVRQTEALARQSVLRYQQTIQAAFREVEDGLIGSVKNREQILAQGRQVTALHDYARLSREKFESGNIGYLQVLDAERQLFSALLTRVQTQTALFISTIDVYKALGGGWLDLADPLAGSSRPSGGAAAAGADK
jgi:outer membrane protein, multidrug efflux system